MIGVDIVSVERIAALDLSAFTDKVCTPAEKEYIFSKVGRTECAAGVFAAKEAVVKALGCGFTGKVTYKQVEVAHDEKGAPFLRLHGEAERLLAERGKEIFLSVSHDGGYAVAFAVIK